MATLAPVLSGAQDASFVAGYAASESIGGAETIYLLGIASGRIDPGATFNDESVSAALIEAAAEYTDESSLTVAEFSFLVATYLDIKSGLLGRLFPGPRYALRDLRREEILRFQADANAPMPGDAALRTIRRAALGGSG